MKFSEAVRRGIEMSPGGKAKRAFQHKCIDGGMVMACLFGCVELSCCLQNEAELFSAIRARWPWLGRTAISTALPDHLQHYAYVDVFVVLNDLTFLTREEIVERYVEPCERELSAAGIPIE